MEAKKPEVMPQLDANRFHLAESMQQSYFCVVEPNVTRKQVINPEFWAHVAARWLRPYAEIRMVSDDGSLYARLMVLQSDRTWAKVHVLEWHDLTTRDVSLSQGEAKAIQAPVETLERYKIEWKGPHHKFCVIDTMANPPVTVRREETTRDNAHLWLTEYIKVQTV